MQAARPAIRYETAATRACLEKVRTLRSDGRAVYATMDAGPNVKLIHEARDDAAVAAVFPSMVTVRPFDPAAV
jgi:diphosphomevalonate decarboxylase